MHGGHHESGMQDVRYRQQTLLSGDPSAAMPLRGTTTRVNGYSSWMPPLQPSPTLPH